MKNPISYNICLSQLLKATVTKSWCLKQLNMFEFPIEGIQGQIKLMDMCWKAVAKAWSGSSEGSISKT